MSKPFFNFAGLYEEAAVCPLTTPSVVSTSHSIFVGKSTDIGFSSRKDMITFKFSVKSFNFSPYNSFLIDICSKLAGSIKKHTTSSEYKKLNSFSSS